MATLESCCFFEGVRQGSYVSLYYCLVFFSITICIMFDYLHDEADYMAGVSDKPFWESFLDMGDASQIATVALACLFMVCAIIGIFTSICAISGMYCNKRKLLLPWIIFMVIDILIEIAHFVYLIFFHNLILNPLISFVFTLDFFIICINIYCLTCVICQYEEFRAGRGFPPNYQLEHRNENGENFNVINLQD